MVNQLLPLMNTLPLSCWMTWNHSPERNKLVLEQVYIYACCMYIYKFTSMHACTNRASIWCLAVLQVWQTNTNKVILYGYCCSWHTPHLSMAHIWQQFLLTTSVFCCLGCLRLEGSWVEEVWLSMPSLHPVHIASSLGGCVAALAAEQQARTRRMNTYQIMEEACVTGGVFYELMRYK